MTVSFALDQGVAIVTGAAGGIGAGVALGLAEAGADVVCITDRNVDGLAQTVESIERIGKRALGITANVADREEMIEAVARTQAELGQLRYAVNCAGIHFEADAETMTAEQWQRIIDVNLSGVFFSSQAQGAAMLENGGGSIVNIGSISAAIANRGLRQVHYNASKAGVAHLSTSLGLEWGRRGVRVNTLSPGYTKTPMAATPEVAALIAGIDDTIPLGRMAEVEEMVGPAVFLLSSASSYVTGQNLLVDGGIVLW